ncbi:MAG: hypothetical protein AB7V50_09430 [Vampirovibrionia bacterium]
MGSKYQYNCSNCDYSVMCCGEESSGYIAVINSYTCHDCNEVVDVNIGLMMEVFDANNIESELKKYQFTDTFKAEEFYTCPECHGKNITVWSESDFSCPKCHSKMQIDYENVMMWD